MTAPPQFMELADEFFNGQCEVTLRKVKPTGFAIHHVRYIENDVERKNYPNTYSGTVQYYRDLAPLIEDEPNRFALITNGVHRKLDGYKTGVCRLKYESRVRFCDLALRTVPKTRWGMQKQ